MSELQNIVDQQAEDEGLWFIAQTGAEAYLQQELRKLHSVVERNMRDAVETTKPVKAGEYLGIPVYFTTSVKE